MITVHLAGIGCQRFEGPGAMESAEAWIKRQLKAAAEDPWNIDTPDDDTILRALESGGNMSSGQIARAITRPVSMIRPQVLILERRGHIQVACRRGMGGAKIWEITRAGRAAIVRPPQTIKTRTKWGN